MTSELTNVKDKLSKQIKLSQHKDKEIQQGEGLIKQFQKKNAKLDQTLDQTKGEVHERNVEIEQKNKEIKNITRQLISSENHTQAVQHDILKLQS